MSANLVLRWPLASIADSRVIDTTDNHLNGRAERDPQSTPDEKFGSCVVFDGRDDAFVLEDSLPIRLRTYTVELWINPNQPSTLVGLIGKPGRNYCMFLHPDGYVRHRFATPTNPDDGFDTARGSIRWQAWQHVAITNDGHTARTYIDGELAGEYSFTGDLVVSQKPLIVGRDLEGGNQNYYGGRMAHVRLYDAPLSALEIQRDMAEDEAALAAFVRTYPIDFNLYNQDQHHVLYIDDDPAGQVMNLELINTSRQELVLPDIGQEVSAQNYHFALGFRPQTIAQSPQPSLATEDGSWVFSRTPDNTSFYLLHKGELRLPAGQSTHLGLRGMNADGRAGTRGTRVELLYQHLKYSGEEAELRGSRLQYLDVVNHRGLREIPLHVGFVGGNTVLSDGSTPSTLQIRIANTSGDSKVRLNAGDTTTPASCFVVSFDVQKAEEPRKWALIDAGNAASAELQVVNEVDDSKKVDGSKSLDWDASDKNNLGQSIKWTIKPQKNVELGPNGSLLLKLDFIALRSLGHANIYVNYQNIPGYQDGLLVAGVEKSPLLFYQASPDAVANVGIGVQEPAAKLQIIHPPENPSGDALVIGPTDGTNVRLGYHQAYGWVQSDGDKPLALNPKGNNVGIGVNEPQRHLQVGGDVGGIGLEHSDKSPNAGYVRFGDYTGWKLHFGRSREAPGNKPLNTGTMGVLMTLQDDGNLGIGTTTPHAKLQVSGGAIMPAVGNSREAGIQFPLDPGGDVGDEAFIRYFVESNETTKLLIGCQNDADDRISFWQFGAERLTIYNGNVGIGTDSPITKLEVKGDNFQIAITNPQKRSWGFVNWTDDKLYFQYREDNVFKSNAMVLDQNGTLGLAAIRIGGTTIGEPELQILKKLAAGGLECDLYNVGQSEYLYPADNTFDSDRRVVWTWAHKDQRVPTKGRWRLTWPA